MGRAEYEGGKELNVEGRGRGREGREGVKCRREEKGEGGEGRS